MKRNILLVIISIFSQFTEAQVLLSENFDNYSAGHLNTDYTGGTIGQGGWIIERHANAIATAMVTPETGKGNVLSITTNGTFSNEYVILTQKDGIIDALWNNRTVGNNVLKFEYEVYGSGNFVSGGGLSGNGYSRLSAVLKATNLYEIVTLNHHTNTSNDILKQYDNTSFPYDMWINIELFIDYNNKKTYFYIPTLNLFRADNIIKNHNDILDNIRIATESLKPITSLVKYDNIKFSALQNVPLYILNKDEQFASKFNIYPNPASNVVNITNSENMAVQQITVYDLTGKQLNTQTFNSESDIQLNVESLSSGIYMLHIKSDSGTAIKKVIKK